MQTSYLFNEIYTSTEIRFTSKFHHFQHNKVNNIFKSTYIITAKKFAFTRLEASFISDNHQLEKGCLKQEICYCTNRTNKIGGRSCMSGPNLKWGKYDMRITK